MLRKKIELHVVSARSGIPVKTPPALEFQRVVPLEIEDVPGKRVHALVVHGREAPPAELLRQAELLRGRLKAAGVEAAVLCLRPGEEAELYELDFTGEHVREEDTALCDLQLERAELRRELVAWGDVANAAHAAATPVWDKACREGGSRRAAVEVLRWLADRVAKLEEENRELRQRQPAIGATGAVSVFAAANTKLANAIVGCDAGRTGTSAGHYPADNGGQRAPASAASILARACGVEYALGGECQLPTGHPGYHCARDGSLF